MELRHRSEVVTGLMLVRGHPVTVGGGVTLGACLMPNRSPHLPTGC